MESAHPAYRASTNQRPHRLLAFPVPPVTLPIALSYLRVHRVRLDFTLPPLEKHIVKLALPEPTTIEWRPQRRVKFVYQASIKMQWVVLRVSCAHVARN